MPMPYGYGSACVRNWKDTTFAPGGTCGCTAMPTIRRKRVCVCVLGDIGRSPRMQYHALSLAEHDFDVTLLGYGGSTPHQDVVTNERISVHNMVEPPRFLQKLPGSYLWKALWQAVILLIALLTMPQPTHILLQNPPGVPALGVVWLASRVRQSYMAVDWHNYGHTILQLALPPSHALVKIATRFEFYFGRKAQVNFCVTRAMQQDLLEKGIQAAVLYDKPAAKYRECPLDERHDLFMRLAQDVPLLCDPEKPGSISLFTADDGDEVVMREDRPAVLLSSTSWTEDEDFSILLKALDEYELAVASGARDLPFLACIITGKGPQKEYYKEVIEDRYYEHIRVCLPWLTAEDYPRMVGSADLGVCLHMSSSGLDLPMKVVDMFGCNLPVCAVDFRCLSELVKHDENGLIFSDAAQLAQQIQDLLEGFPHGCSKLQQLRANLRAAPAVGWSENWDSVVLPVIANAPEL